MANNQLETRYRKLISLDVEYTDDEYEEIHPLMGYFKLSIPEYQRPYSWKKDNINTLLQDIYAQLENHKDDDYFVGMIFTLEPDKSSDKKTYEIVDGQQRLTSFNLILIWLKNNFSSNPEFEDYNRFVRKINLISESPADKNLLDMVNKSVSNQVVFANIKKAKKEALKHKDTFLAKQCDIFRIVFDNIQKFFLKIEKDDPKKIGDFYRYIFDKIRILHIIDKPYSLTGDQFFLSLNGKGLKLDQVDLLKSTFIRPFMSLDDNKIGEFKKLWAGLIKNTKNDMLTKIVNYFRSEFSSQYSKISNGNINYIVNKELKTNELLKTKFIEMCHYFRDTSPITEAESDSHKINFWVKLNRKFNFKRYDEIIITAITKTKNFDISKKACKEVIERILENLFKLNFIYTKGVFNLPAGRFIEEVIVWCKNQVLAANTTNTANFIDGILSKKLDDIIKGKDEIMGKSFADYEPDFNSYVYTGKKDQPTLALFLLKLIAKTYDKASSNDLMYSTASDCVDWHLDHYVPKAANKAKFIGEDGKTKKIWESSKKNDQSFITFVDDNINIFQEDFAIKNKIKNGMSYESFRDILNRPFNIRLMKEQDNKGKSSKVSLTLSDLKKHFSIPNEMDSIETLEKSWNWFFYKKFKCSSNSYTYNDVWQKIEYYLRNILNDHDTQATDLIKIAYLDEHILTRDEKDLCHKIRMTRNQQHRNLEKPSIEKELIPSVDKLISKLKKIYAERIGN